MPYLLKFISVTCKLSTKDEVLQAIHTASLQNPVRIATLNPEFMLEAEKNPEFRYALSTMTHCVIDGSGLLFALRIWRFLRSVSMPLEKCPGSTLAEELFMEYSTGSKHFFLLGGPPNLANKAATSIQRLHPGISIVGSSDGGSINRSKPHIDSELIQSITQLKTDILLVGFGAPKQELWIDRAASANPSPVMIGLGGTFHFYTTKKRAPLLLRTLHLEWLYRGITEKGHWQRVLKATVVFPIHALLWIARNIFTPI